jgi:4-coumarate--CoA ligase
VAPLLSPHTLELVLRHLFLYEVAHLRGRPVTALAAEWGPWDVSRPFQDAALDSFERLQLASAVNELFHLHETGWEDHLLRMKCLGEWVQLVESAQKEYRDCFTFRTSGSTGEPRRITHRLDRLWAEAQYWAALAAGRGTQNGAAAASRITRVVVAVPTHRIYGFLHGALVACAGGWPVHDILLAPETKNWQRGSRFAAGDWVVATPTLWEYFAAGSFPPGVQGVSSGAPCPPALVDRLEERGLSGWLDVYGSSETAGLGYRRTARGPYQRLVLRDPAGEEIAAPAAVPPDELAWIDADHFWVGARRDQAVAVGGVNVFPARIARELEQYPGVRQAAVRFEPSLGRLKAFLAGTPPGGDPNPVPLSRWCRARLTAPECPVRFTWGEALPSDPQGKLCDWPVPDLPPADGLSPDDERPAPGGSVLDAGAIHPEVLGSPANRAGEGAEKPEGGPRTSHARPDSGVSIRG